MAFKINLYCPVESTMPALNGAAKFPGIPAVGDIICCPSLAPAAGPGASSYFFVVTSRCWGPGDEISLRLTHRLGEEPR